MKINFVDEQVPDATTLLKFRHLLEEYNIGKGNQYYFGMKCHAGVDAGSGYVHIIREDDRVVYGDSGYIGIEQREEVQSSPYLSGKDYRINRRCKSVQQMPSGQIEWEQAIERRKSSVRSKVEHPFLLVKRYFGFAKTVYRILGVPFYPPGMDLGENKSTALYN
jgi:IS5 family transposase